MAKRQPATQAAPAGAAPRVSDEDLDRWATEQAFAASIHQAGLPIVIDPAWLDRTGLLIAEVRALRQAAAPPPAGQLPFDPAHPGYCLRDKACSLATGHPGGCDLTAGL